jgi:hypothetical protein
MADRNGKRAAPRRAGTRAAVVAAALTFLAGTRFASADLVMADARDVRDACMAAETELVAAKAKAGNLNDSFKTSLLIGQIHTLNAYRSSLFANWPSSLAAIRARVEDSMTTSLNKLAPLSLPSASTLNVAGVLDVEIARIHNVVAILNGQADAATPLPTINPTPTTPTAPTTPTSVIADLVPGTGFTGATQQPTAYGTGLGSDAKAIARWDVVPYQTIAGKLPVGVVAFHMGGIDRVEFSVNGGTWTAVRSMTLNPVTGVWEYNANVDAATLADGGVEVRAVVYPKVGTPRVLAGPHDTSDAAMVSGEHSLFLSSNKNSSLAAATRYVSATGSDSTGTGTSSAPFATITRAAADIQTTGGAAGANGATIYLSSGDYAWPDLSFPNPAPQTTNRWLTISAAPGVSKDNVRFTSIQNPNTSKGLNTALVRVKGVSFRNIDVVSGTWSNNWRVWIDGCTLEGGGPTVSNWQIRPDEWRGGVYVTDSVFKNVRNASWGATLLRNVVIQDIGGDGVRDPQGLVVNVEEKNVVNYDDDHCDVLQFVSPPVASKFENVIVYGLKAVQNIQAQALFAQQYGSTAFFENFAFVNYLSYSIYGGQWQNPAKHVLFWNMEMLSPPEALSVNKGGMMICDVTGGGARSTNVHDLSVKNSVFQRFNALQTGSEPSATDTSWADGCHFVDSTSYMALTAGTHASVGGTATSLFVDAAHGDFTRVAGTSLLANQIQTLLVPGDVNGRARRTPDAPGAWGVTQ